MGGLASTVLLVALKTLMADSVSMTVTAVRISVSPRKWMHTFIYRYDIISNKYGIQLHKRIKNNLYLKL